MKIKIVKCSDPNLWYNWIIDSQVEDYIVEIKDCIDLSNFDGLSKDYKPSDFYVEINNGSLILKKDCVNWEDYDDKQLNLFEEIDNKSDKRVFESGAKRDSNEGKIRPDLISPYMLKALGKVLADGAEHYGDRNWEKGMPQEVFKESASRHFVSWLNNEIDEDHAAKLIFNVMGWIHFRDKNN